MQECKTRNFVCPILKERDYVGDMLKIARNHRTESQGDIKEILKRRAKIYCVNLDPKWFSYDIDLGVKATSMEDRNKARAMLAAAPLMVAQLGALEFGKRMLKGDERMLSTIRLEEKMTVSQVLKKLEALPPLTVLKLCNMELGEFVFDSLLQHLDDLDFVQDVLDTVAHPALTPTMHAVLAGFSRRRNYGRFKHNQRSIAMDRVGFIHIVSPTDNDGGIKMNTDRQSKGGESKRVCPYFQRPAGCRNVDACFFEHKCIICNGKSHGAVNCKDRLQRSARAKNGRKSAPSEKDKRYKSLPFRSRRNSR